MNKSVSLITKLSIFIVFALIFGATMIALSMRGTKPMMIDNLSWERGDKGVEKTFTVKSGGLLSLTTDVGVVMVSGTEKEEVKIVVKMRGSEERIKKFTVGFEQNENTVKVVGKNERNHFNFFGDGGLDVRYEVQVPVNFNLHIETAGGDIIVEDVKGKIEGGTSGGEIELRKTDGQVDLTTSGGDIKMNECSGSLVVSTSGGNITADRVVGDMDVETSGGNITVRNSDGKVNGSTSGGDIRVELKDNKGIDLSTSGGNVIVTLPKNITGEVQASTTGGDVNCDLPFSGKIKHGNMNGTINGGGKLIKLETTGGDISINSRD